MLGSKLQRLVTIMLGLSVVLLLPTGVAAGAGTAAEQTDQSTGSITAVGQTHTADAIGNTTYVWNYTSQGLAVDTYRLSANTQSASTHSEVCLSRNGTTTCRPLGGDTAVSFAIPGNSTGQTTQLNLTLRDGVTGEVLDSESYTMHRLSRLGDYDDDGLNNRDEVRLGANLSAVDTDGDGVHDGVEVSEYNTSVTAADSDGDGLGDSREIALGSAPTTADTDDDGLDDGREIAVGSDPLSADTDDDGLDDGREIELGSDPLTADTDDDGLDDSREIDLGSDPLTADTDDDGLGDSREIDLGSDPLTADTDDD